jgi:hypothetical protein
VTIDKAEAFAAFGQTQLVSATKAKLRQAEKRAIKREAEAPMMPTPLEKKQQDEQRQLKRWRHWRREELRTEVQARPQEWRELNRILRKLTINDAWSLIEYVRKSTWMHEADLQTRRVVLRTINARIMRVRVQNGLEPIDDALPGEPPTVSETMYDLLMKREANGKPVDN